MGKSKPLGRMDLIPTETWQDLARAHHTATGGGGEEMGYLEHAEPVGVFFLSHAYASLPQSSFRVDYGRHCTTRTS